MLLRPHSIVRKWSHTHSRCLYRLLSSGNCLTTPHYAWFSSKSAHGPPTSNASATNANANDVIPIRVVSHYLGSSPDSPWLTNYVPLLTFTIHWWFAWGPTQVTPIQSCPKCALVMCYPSIENCHLAVAKFGATFGYPWISAPDLAYLTSMEREQREGSKAGGS